MRVEKDYRDFLKLLGAKKAIYLTVGGYAYSYHAEPRYTKDIDILVEATKENGARVVAAIAEFWGMKPEVEPADFLRRDTVIQLGLAPVRIDIITSCAGIEFPSALFYLARRLDQEQEGGRSRQRLARRQVS